MRTCLALSFLLAACASPPASDSSYEPERPGPAAEIAPGGLSLDQVATLRGLGMPIVIPSDVGTFELVGFEAESMDYETSYALAYRRSDGVCFEVSGATGGFGGPQYPLVSTEVRIRDLGRTIRLYEASRDPGATSAQVWGVGTVVSDFIDLDGPAALFISDTQDGCRPVSLAEGAEIVAGLRRLSSPGGAARPPQSDIQGPFAPADDLLEDYNAATSPEMAANAFADRYDGEADRVMVELDTQTEAEAVVFVTALGLADDSIRDERLRLVYENNGVGTWELVDAGRQVRCQSGRGHTDWSDRACL